MWIDLHGKVDVGVGEGVVNRLLEGLNGVEPLVKNLYVRVFKVRVFW